MVTTANIENPFLPNKSDLECQRLQTELLRLFSERLDAEVPSNTTDLFETGILDSQRFVELLLHIEQKFDVEISIEQFEIANFRSIEGIANLILRHNHSTKPS